MEFRKYQHVERFGNADVQSIEIGTTYVFSKIDGTNSSVWLGNNGELCAGSRNRQLSLDRDNAGFLAAISKDQRILNYLHKHPSHRLFGEWLVPHTLKTYREDAWRKFYIFDVCLDNDNMQGGLEYIPYDIYQPFLEEFSLDYIAPIRIVKNGDYDSFVKALDVNDFLIKDGLGNGEGIVIKNYDFYNKYGKQIWAKIVTSEFKERHYKEMGSPVIENKMVEQAVVDEFVTSAFVEKEYNKILNEQNGEWNSRLIQRLLETVYHELICEEMWQILKKYKNPTLNFKTLKILTTGKIKEVKSSIFM